MVRPKGGPGPVDPPPPLAVEAMPLCASGGYLAVKWAKAVAVTFPRS